MRVRLKIAPQRGQALALAEIIAPHARHEVILVMTLPWSSRNRSSGQGPGRRPKRYATE
jgi:tetratricopeptide (TPR) repeat protein